MLTVIVLLLGPPRGPSVTWGSRAFIPATVTVDFAVETRLSWLIQKQTRVKESRLAVCLFFSSVHIPVFHTRLSIVISVSLGLLEDVC